MSGHRTNLCKDGKDLETDDSPILPQISNEPHCKKDDRVPSLVNVNNQLSNIKSEAHFARKSLLSQEKRVRLRDYLFTAHSSLQKNRELKKEMKNNIADRDNLKKSIESLKKNKYQISNYQMHKIVKKQIETQLKDIISNLRDALEYIQSQDLNQVSTDDLTYFYEIRKIVKEKIKPSMIQMQQASINRQKTLIKQMFSIGRGLAGGNGQGSQLESQDLGQTGAFRSKLKEDPIKEEVEYEKPPELEKHHPIDLIQSLIMGKR